MKRRSILVFAALLSAALAGSPARADMVDDVVGELRSMGYSAITVERTLLGRVRIIATDGGGYREIIVNPRTGEILRDLFVRSGGNGGARLLGASRDVEDDDDDHGGNSGRGGGGSGSSGDDDDDDDDDDSGGGGGGNSGSGGGDDDSGGDDD